MPTYATKADCLAYIEGLTVDDDAAFDRVIERAEDQIDRVLGQEVPVAGGRKYSGSTLTALEARTREALKRAVCAQVEYRIEMGERFFTRAQHESVSGPDFTTQGKLPRIGPKVWEELRSSGLARMTTSIGGDRPDPNDTDSWPRV
jgi:hypothetical protein